jgi:hypothetical protein
MIPMHAGSLVKGRKMLMEIEERAEKLAVEHKRVTHS